jgi:hypothetical protein
MNMLLLIQLADAIHIVFRHRAELTEKDFQELTAAQYEAFNRSEGKADQRIYRMLLAEPTVIERTPERTTLELSIVTESDRARLLAAVKFIHSSTKELKTPDGEEPSFTDRLDYLGRVWPPVITGSA